MASIRKADRAVSLFVIDPFEIRSYRIVVQQLLELRGRYLVGVQVLLVLIIPIEFDFRRDSAYIVSQRIYVQDCLPPACRTKIESFLIPPK